MAIQGSVLLTGYFTEGETGDPDVPTLVLLPTAVFEPTKYAGASVRQSRIVVRGSGNEVLSGRLEAELDIDFFDGSRLDPKPRLRRAVARLNWPNGWLLFGQERLPFSDLDPASVASVARPGFTDAGNLSPWLPQVRLGVQTSGALRVGLEAAAIAPRLDGTSTQPAERVRRPFLQGRLLATWDAGGALGSVALTGHLGWFRGPADTLLASRAVGAALQLPLTSYAQLRAEAFWGEALATLGGALGQNLGSDGGLVRSRGGWAQLLLSPAPDLELGGGYGADDPEDEDLGPAPVLARLRNVSWEVHVTWRPAPLVFGAEYRRLETAYQTGTVGLLPVANHVSVVLGWEF